MKKGRFILLFAAAALVTGCFKDVSYDTTYVLKPLVQENSGDAVRPLEAGKAQAYAYGADTTYWTVASYEDALGGVISRRDNPSEKLTAPLATAEPYEQEGDASWLRMQLTKELVMVVVVDQTNELYAYSKQVVDLTGESVTFPVVFRMWRPEYLYVEDGWRVVNERNAAPQQGTGTSKR